MPPELQRELDEETERIIDDWVEAKHAHDADICETCGHKLHPQCNGGNCDEPHFDPQNPPEPPDYD